MISLVYEIFKSLSTKMPAKLVMIEQALGPLSKDWRDNPEEVHRKDCIKIDRLGANSRDFKSGTGNITV